MKNWEKIKLGDLCEVITKGTTPTSIGYNFTDSGIKFIKVESLTESGEIIPNKVAYIDEACHQALKRSQLKKNDILFSIAGALGRIGIVKEDILPANTNQALAIIRLKKDSNAIVEFIAKYFNSNIVTDEIEKLRIGAAQQNLSLTQLNNLFVPLPPLPEQQRIVSILDEAFAAIAKAKDNAEQNLKNAKELFESYLQGVFENGNWEMKTIEMVCDEIFAGGDAPKNNYSLEPNEKHNIPIYANAVKDRGLYGYTDFARVTKPCVTIAARGSGTGHTELRNEPFLPIVRLIVCIPDTEQISNEFLKYTIDNLVIQRSGSAIPQLTVPMIKDYKIPVTSIEEQKLIIEKAEILKQQKENLESVYLQKIEGLEELKKSILQKAFAGELKTEKALAI